MKWSPHDYQLRAARFLVENSHGGLFLDPGLGKTSVVLAAYKALRRARFVKRALVIAPLRVCYLVWPKEVQKWDDFREFSVGVLHGTQEERAQVFSGNHDIQVINPDGLEWLVKHVGTKVPWDMLVCDESTLFKYTNTKRFKLLKGLLPYFRRRVILTGTPTPNSLLDLFGQMFIVDRGESLGRYVTHYRNAYFMQSGFGGYTWVPLPGAPERIYKVLGPRTLRMSAEEYLKLPPLIEANIYVDLPAKARKLYREMEKEFMLELDSGTVTAANAAVKMGHCRQIANGGLYTDTQAGKWEPIHTAKVEAVQELVEGLEGKPALVVYEYRHDLERLKKAFKGAPHIGGDVTPAETETIVKDWNAGRLPVLLVHPKSVGHGLNMQESGSAVIFHSLTWSFEEYDQLVRRIWRQGQRAEKVFVYHILAIDTVDDAVLGAIKSKKRGQAALFDALVEYRKKVLDRKSK